jgi:hypothetical protein
MKISAAGAGVGALVGCVGRGAVVLLNFGPAGGSLPAIALPSAGIGLLVGAIAGAVGRPLLGAALGAILSGVVFELFMFAGASLIGAFDQHRGAAFLSQTLLYGLEMAVAGALAGGLGGLVGQAAAPKQSKAADAAPFGEAGERHAYQGKTHHRSMPGPELSEHIRRKEDRE